MSSVLLVDAQYVCAWCCIFCAAGRCLVCLCAWCCVSVLLVDAQYVFVHDVVSSVLLVDAQYVFVHDVVSSVLLVDAQYVCAWCCIFCAAGRCSVCLCAWCCVFCAAGRCSVCLCAESQWASFYWIFCFDEMLTRWLVRSIFYGTWNEETISIKVSFKDLFSTWLIHKLLQFDLVIFKPSKNVRYDHTRNIYMKLVWSWTTYILVRQYPSI